MTFGKVANDGDVKEKRAISVSIAAAAASASQLSTQSASPSSPKDQLTLNYFGNMDIECVKQPQEAAVPSETTRSLMGKDGISAKNDSTISTAALGGVDANPSLNLRVFGAPTSAGSSVTAATTSTDATSWKPQVAPTAINASATQPTLTSTCTSAPKPGLVSAPALAPSSTPGAAPQPAPHVFATASAAETFQRLQAILGKYSTASSTASVVVASSTASTFATTSSTASSSFTSSSLSASAQTASSFSST